MKRFSQFVLFVLLIAPHTIAQDKYADEKSLNLQIMTADGEMGNDLYVLKKASLTDSAVIKVHNAASATFIGESARLYSYVQNFLVNKGTIDKPESLVLAISDRQGCFGVMGFVLDENGKRTAKPFMLSTLMLPSLQTS